MIKKITIGIAGAEAKTGCTHMALVMSNFLKNRGYKVALIENNDSGAFEEIRSASGQLMTEENSFIYNNIHFFPYINAGIIRNIMNSDYSFVIYDLGSYKTCNKMLLAECDIPIIMCGSKPWEVIALGDIFEDIDERSLKNYVFYFNFCSENQQTKKDIIEGMDVLKKVYFPLYTENPFVCENFPGVEEILENIFEEENNKQKEKAKDRVRFFSNNKKKEQNQNRQEIISEDNYATSSVNNDTNIPEPIKKVIENEEVFDTLIVTDKQDNTSQEKKKPFGIMNFGNKQPKQPRNPEMNIEIRNVLKNLSYTQPEMKEVLLTSRANISKIRKDDKLQENKQKLSLLSYAIYQNAYCGVIRSGTIHRKTNGPDGKATIIMTIGNKEIPCEESVLINILGEDCSIINPYENDYMEV